MLFKILHSHYTIHPVNHRFQQLLQRKTPCQNDVLFFATHWQKIINCPMRSLNTEYQKQQQSKIVNIELNKFTLTLSKIALRWFPTTFRSKNKNDIIARKKYHNSKLKLHHQTVLFKAKSKKSSKNTKKKKSTSCTTFLLLLSSYALISVEL